VSFGWLARQSQFDFFDVLHVPSVELASADDLMVVDCQLAAADLHDLAGVELALEVDELKLVRLAGQLGLGGVPGREHPAAELLPRGDDLPHPARDEEIQT